MLTVTITDAGVAPTSGTIVVGGLVFATNQSSNTQVIQSNPHPIHTDCPSLNATGSLAPGTNGLTGVFDVPVTCGFHDRMNLGDGSLQVQVAIGSAGMIPTAAMALTRAVGIFCRGR